MTSKFILTASVAAIALTVGSFAVIGDAFARGGGGHGGGHGSNGSSRSMQSSMSYGKSSSMKMSSSHKHHHHHHRKRVTVGGLDGCDGYYKNGVCIEDDDDED
jgi:hypothetical protein